MESQQKRSLGPQELTQILKDFESQTRKNVESQVERLAKTKFGRNLLTKLLQSSAKTASAQETTEQNSDPTPAQQTYEPTQDRAFRLSRLTSSELREQARKKALDRWRDR